MNNFELFFLIDSSGCFDIFHQLVDANDKSPYNKGLWKRRSRFGHYDAANTTFTFSTDPVHYFSRMYLGNFFIEIISTIGLIISIYLFQEGV